MTEFAGLEHHPGGIIPVPDVVLKGIHRIRQTAPEGDSDGFATLFLRRNAYGLLARSYLKRHPLQFNVRMYREGWKDWRDVVLPVRIEWVEDE